MNKALFSCDTSKFVFLGILEKDFYFIFISSHFFSVLQLTKIISIIKMQCTERFQMSDDWLYMYPP